MITHGEALKNNWNRSKPEIRHRWNRLSDQDISQIDGDSEKLVGRLQQQYGYDRERAEQEVESFCNTLEGSSATPGSRGSAAGQRQGDRSGSEGTSGSKSERGSERSESRSGERESTTSTGGTRPGQGASSDSGASRSGQDTQSSGPGGSGSDRGPSRREDEQRGSGNREAGSSG